MDLKLAKCNSCGKTTDKPETEAGWIRITAGIGSNLIFTVANGTEYGAGDLRLAPCIRERCPVDFCSTDCLLDMLKKAIVPPARKPLATQPTPAGPQ